MTPLFGHDSAVALFCEGLSSHRLHHAWLIAGPEGIGKRLFAEKAALRLLAQAAGPPIAEPGLDVPDAHRIATFFRADSHPDLLRLERLPAKKELHGEPRASWYGNAELARSIKVDQVRALRPRLATKPGLSSARAIIVDSADVLEVASANALLKMLEEPPEGTVFFLLAQRSEAVLPTIRSRCRQLRLSPLNDDAMASALAFCLPDATRAEIESLVAVGQGAPGQALNLRGLDIDKLDQAMRQLIGAGDPTNAGRVKLAADLALKAAQPRYEIFLARAPSFIADEARLRRGAALAHALALWERARDLAGGAVRLSLDPHSVVFELGGMLASLHEGRRTAA